MTFIDFVRTLNVLVLETTDEILDYISIKDKTILKILSNNQPGMYFFNNEEVSKIIILKFPNGDLLLFESESKFIVNMIDEYICNIYSFRDKEKNYLII